MHNESYKLRTSGKDVEIANLNAIKERMSVTVTLNRSPGTFGGMTQVVVDISAIMKIGMITLCTKYSYRRSTLISTMNR